MATKDSNLSIAEPATSGLPRKHLLASSSIFAAIAFPQSALADCAEVSSTEIVCDSDDADGFDGSNYSSVTFTIDSGVTVGGMVSLADDNTVTIDGSLATHSMGLFLGGGNNVTVNGSISTTLEAAGYGIYGGAESIATINGTVNTIGDFSPAISFDSNSQITISATGAVTTSGDASSGVFMGADSQLILDGTVTTSGQNLYSVQGTDNFVLTSNVGSLIESLGDSSPAIHVQNDADVLVGGSVTTSGAESPAIVLEGRGSFVEISGSVEAAFGEATITTTSALFANTVSVLSGGSLIGADNGLVNVAFLSGDAGDTFSNAGSVSGYVYLAGGDDTYNFAGGTIDGSVIGGDGNDTVLFESGVASLLSNEISGFEFLSVTGGELTLLPGSGLDGIDVNFAFDDVGITGGELVVGPDAILDTPLVTVGVNGILSGVGVITGDVINEGTVAPGMSVGTLTINGDLTLDPGSVVEIFFDDTGNSVIIVDGTANLNGGGFLLTGTSIADGEFTIITADTFVETAETPVVASASLPFADVTDISFDDSGFVIEVESSLDADSLSGLSGQAQIMGDALASEITAGLSTEMFDDLVALSLAAGSIGMDSALRGLSPEVYAGAPVVAAFEQDRLLTSALQRRFRTGGEVEKGEGTVWGGVGASTSQLDGVNGYLGAAVNATGFDIGGDYRVTDDLALGFVSAINYADVSFDDLIAGFEGTGYSFGAYGMYNQGAFDVSGFVTYGIAEYDADRAVGNDAAQAPADAALDVTSIHAYAEISKEYDLRHGYKFRPYVAYDFFQVKRGGFAENSSSTLALVVQEETEVASVVDFGALISKTYVSMNGKDLKMFAGVGYRHSVGDDDAVATASFAGGSGVEFTANGAFLPDKAVTAKAGFTANLGDAWSVSGEYAGSFLGDYASHGGKLALNFSF